MSKYITKEEMEKFLFDFFKKFSNNNKTSRINDNGWLKINIDFMIDKLNLVYYKIGKLTELRSEYEGSYFEDTYKDELEKLIRKKDALKKGIKNLIKKL